MLLLKLKNMAITWKQDYSVGVKEIDLQHQRFVDLMNQTYDTLYKDESKEKIINLVEEIFSHGALHFHTEEGYFDKFNYPNTDEHKRAHLNLLNQTTSFKTRIGSESDYKKAVSDLIDFLENWLVEHMLTHDKKYTKFFNDNGLF